MNYILDVIIVTVLLLFVLFGAKKGIIRSLGEFVGAIVAAIVSSAIGAKVAEAIYNSFFRQSVITKINSALAVNSGDATDYFSSLPDFVVSWLNNSGITEQSVSDAMNSGSKTAASAVESVISPLLIGVIKVFAIIVVFMLLMIIIKILLKIIAGLFELPVLKQIDGIFGGVFGFLVGAIVIWVVLGAIQFFKPMMSQSVREKVNTAIDNSVIYELVEDSNPFEWIFE
jgi:uncharacterized membrane protein required for colicin V production